MSYSNIIQGDAREVLRTLPEASVDMAMTSPSYWGLRKYHGDSQIWDGEDGCDHEWLSQDYLLHSGRGDAQKSGKYSTQESIPDTPVSQDYCLKCGAWRGQLGLEPSPDLYIAHLMQIFDGVKRVLKPAGSLYVNIADSYAANRSYQVDGTKQVNGSQPSIKQPQASDYNIPAKSLVGIPERFVLTMLARGWIRRNTLVWWKRSCMPSSANDRYTIDFEYLYFFTKQQDYYFETQYESYSPTERWGGDIYKRAVKGDGKIESAGLDRERSCYPSSQGRLKRCVWDISTEPLSIQCCQNCYHVYDKKRYERLQTILGGHKCKCAEDYENPEDYHPDWSQTSQWITSEIMGKPMEYEVEAYRCNLCGRIYQVVDYNKLPEAITRICRECGSTEWVSHYAAYPTELCRTPILASCPEFICDKCGEPRRKMYEGRSKQAFSIRIRDAVKRPEKWSGTKNLALASAVEKQNYNEQEYGDDEGKQFLGYSTCSCPEPSYHLGVVLDPFCGTGSTGVMAKLLGRNFIGIDCSEAYIKMSEHRLRHTVRQGSFRES